MFEFFDMLLSTWWGISIVVVILLLVVVLLSALFYKHFFKRFYDIVISGIDIILLTPVFLVLIILGAIKMKGNPFFTQQRPGKNGKIFRLVKFRTMNNAKDESGNLLPDEFRLTRYGKILRATSLDEIPELLNIFIGNMSFVGPRPLLVKYLPLYNEFQAHRHDVRPGLTGWAQANGRNSISWEERFVLDVFYVNNLSLWLDIKIIFLTVKSVLSREGISSETNATMEEFKGQE